MKISTEINSTALRFGEEKAVELVGKAGFDAWDLSMFPMCVLDKNGKVTPGNTHPFASKDYLKFVRRLKQIGLDNGIVCNQSHAPFPSTAAMQPYLMRAIECTAEAGGKICIKIATENMWMWDEEKDQSSFAACATSEDFLKHLNLVNDDYLVACLDIGHAEMRGSGSGAANMIRALGHHLEALHMHDNDRLHDSHQLPFSMEIDFDEVTAALREINYQGYITLEADSYLKSFPKDADEKKVFEGLKVLAAAARRLADMVEAR